MKAIEVLGLSKTYSRGKRAVDGLSFEVGTGTVAGFIGRNGAGKTTTINAMAGILRPDAGSVSILGEAVRPGDWRYKSRVGFLMERPNYVENLTGREYLRFACVMQKIPKSEATARIEELLGFFELDSEAGKTIRDYSKGMKKKISLAAALIHNPELLVLDEPLEGVDPVSANMIKNFLLSFAEKGKSVFVSSHELGAIEKICGDLVIVDNGRLLYRGTADGLKAAVGGDGQTSLEELFVSLVAKGRKSDGLSWL